MYSEQQIEDIKRRVREQDTKVFDIWLNQYNNKEDKEEYYDPRYDQE
jgi:hypothetical protein